MKLNLNSCSSFAAAAARLVPLVGAEISDAGIPVEAVQGERIGVSLKGGKATIYYRERVHFFRGLGLLVENAKRSDRFDITEDGYFTGLSAMIDASRCGVPRVSSVKRIIDYLALMGYTMMMLYTEDVVKLEGRPYFGYMRGRYTVEDMREIDDYADAYGVEVIPCLELYGHMEKYLIWPEASKIKDTNGVMMARSDETFAFVEELIVTVTSAFRSKRIHIGMDEAWDMGRGKFLDKYGYVPPFDIFNEYMERLISITNKYGLTPMMWSDMYFRVHAADKISYYNEDIVVPESTKALIPKEVELVFWHYGEHHHCDDYMMKKHNELGRKVIFAGGNWGWIGHFPEHNYMMSTLKFSLDACRNNDVREAMLTVWCNDNAECDSFANLFGLSYFAEIAYDKDASDEKLRSRFEAVTGGNYELFYKMSYYHNDFEKSNDYPKYSLRFLGKPLFWQDILGGLYDTHLFKKAMSGHYAATAKEFAGKADKDRWGYLYEYAYRVFDYMAIKTLIAEKLYPAYQAGDKATLAEIKNDLLPALKEKTVALHEHHRRIWFMNNNVIGWQNLDTRYGGMASRCDTAMLLLDAYLAGEVDRLEELEEPRLDKGLSGFIHYSSINTVNLKT